MSADLMQVLENVVREELNKVNVGERVRTVDFVARVIDRVKPALKLDEAGEARVRPMVVDVLWRLQRLGLVRFSDDLITFEKVQSS